MLKRKYNKIAFFSFAVIASVAAHSWAIYMLQDYRIDFYSPKQAFMENHLAELQKDTQANKKEMVKRRNEQLNQTFNELIKLAKESKSSNYDISQIRTEYAAPTEPAIDIPLETPSSPDDPAINSLDAAAFAESKPFLDQLIISSVKTDDAPPLQPKKVDLLFPEDKGIANELMKATQIAQGSVSADNLESLDFTHTIKAGEIDNSSINGNFTENRSGLIEQDQSEVLSPTNPSLMALTDAAASQQEALAKMSSAPLAQSPNERLSPLKDEKSTMASRNSQDLFDMRNIVAVAASSDFTVQVEYAQKRNAPGYLFRLQLIPRQDVQFKRIVQNVLFLIDRSQSIRPARYEASKIAVINALGLLQKGDTFNVLVFDKNVSKLSEKNLAWTKENIQKAREFLLRQPYGGIFATTDLYSSLGNIIPDAVAANEVNTAILLSDGDTYLTKEQQRTRIANWTKQNSGKVSLYGIASGSGNNLPLLDVLSAFNKGALYYASRDEEINDVLISLMRLIQNPIAKDIVATPITSEAEASILIYPPAQRLPNMYENASYVVYGSINTLKDFHIFFQGKYYDRWLDIKQLVTFRNAKPVMDSSLEKPWALQQAYGFYDKYLNEGSIKYLDRARQFLAPYKIPVAFQ